MKALLRLLSSALLRSTYDKVEVRHNEHTKELDLVSKNPHKFNGRTDDDDECVVSVCNALWPLLWQGHS